MTPVERVELLELRDEIRGLFHDVRADIARGFRDVAVRENETRERVTRLEGRIEGSLSMVKWLGPGGIAALLLGLLAQAGVLR